MRAVVIEEKNKLRLQEAAMHVLQDGEALIKVKYCGICGSDIHVLRGEHPTARFPVIPGHEFVGELVDIKGSGSQRYEIGDYVVAQPFFSCGNCEPCAKGEDNVCADLQFMGAHADGGFAQYVKVATRKMYRIPKDMDLQLAALTEPVAVAVHDVRRSGLQVGETALIIGGGPIGMLIAMIARRAGARQVVISEISSYRRKAAEDLGFVTVDPTDSGFDRSIETLTEGKGFDVCFEVSGTKPGYCHRRGKGQNHRHYRGGGHDQGATSGGSVGSFRQRTDHQRRPHSFPVQLHRRHRAAEGWRSQRGIPYHDQQSVPDGTGRRGVCLCSGSRRLFQGVNRNVGKENFT